MAKCATTACVRVVDWAEGCGLTHPPHLLTVFRSDSDIIGPDITASYRAEVPHPHTITDVHTDERYKCVAPVVSDMLPTMEAHSDVLDDEEIGGKRLSGTARGVVESYGPGPDKTVYDVVTKDGMVYRFEQQRPGEPFTFAPSAAPSRASRSGRLPGVVEFILDHVFTDDDGDPEPGWTY